MEIIITAWGLDSYLALRHANQLSAADYKKTIRPDVLLLRSFPGPANFDSNKFWSPAEVQGTAIPGCFKMKWHNLGDGQIQVRLPVGMRVKEAFLLNAYVKKDPKFEARQLVKSRAYLDMIRQGIHIECGRLS